VYTGTGRVTVERCFDSISFRVLGCGCGDVWIDWSHDNAAFSCASALLPAASSHHLVVPRVMCAASSQLSTAAVDHIRCLLGLCLDPQERTAPSMRQCQQSAVSHTHWQLLLQCIVLSAVREVR
jgi:hypothetical protein